MHRLGELAADGPIVVLRSGKPISIVITPAKYDRLIIEAEQAAQGQATVTPETKT